MRNPLCSFLRRIFCCQRETKEVEEGRARFDAANRVNLQFPQESTNKRAFKNEYIDVVLPQSNSKAMQLTDYSWYHGKLAREEAEDLLRKEGDFLMRESSHNGDFLIILSVLWRTHQHFKIEKNEEGFYRYNGPAFDCAGKLVTHYYEKKKPFKNDINLRRPIPVQSDQDQPQVLNRSDVMLGNKIGKGNFGEVYDGYLRGRDLKVAVKFCNNEDDNVKFIEEGNTMKKYSHPNVVKFIGMCTERPIMIVMELVSGGSLLQYLRKQRNEIYHNVQPLRSSQLTKMCLDVAIGMCYLEENNCIHRDLAARNCLITDTMIVKISDFGMSRGDTIYQTTFEKPIPFKWTAPEAINEGTYTSLSDVWSYGILCWEIFSMGQDPYNGIPNEKLVSKLKNGYRMPKPANTPSEMYELMQRCWQWYPKQRINFPEIKNYIRNYSEYTL